MKYNYGGIYKEYPLEEGEPYIFDDGSTIQVHNIYEETPRFMYEADVLFIDPPWNLGNLFQSLIGRLKTLVCPGHTTN